MNERYIYGKLNEEVKPVTYTGEITETIEVEVDNTKRKIKANLREGVIPTYTGETTETAEVNIDGTEIRVNVNQEKMLDITKYTVGEVTGATLDIDNDNRTISLSVEQPEVPVYTGGTTQTADVSVSDEYVITVDVLDVGHDYQAQDTDTIDTNIDNYIISSNLVVNKEKFEVGQVVDSIWFDTSLTAEELGTKIISLFSVEYDLSESFGITLSVIFGRYYTESPNSVLEFPWHHRVTVEEPSLMGNGDISIDVKLDGLSYTTIAYLEYDWEYVGGEYIFTWSSIDWRDSLINQRVMMITEPTITTVLPYNENVWNGEFIRNKVQMTLIGTSSGKIYDSKVNRDIVLTTEKQYLTAEQQAQVLENLGLVNAQNRYY